jgi:hypothetical protein
MASKPSKQKQDRASKLVSFRAELDADLQSFYDKSFGGSHRLEILMIQLLRTMKKK